MSNIISLTANAIPETLQKLSDAPTQLFVRSDNLGDLLARPRVAIVGSRKVTPYGKAATSQFAGELAARGVVIVSGLALGVDALAHQAALDAGGLTIAVLPTGLDKIYPSTHTNLAKNIIEQGGALLTEYPHGTRGFRGNFVQRNRLVSGLSDVVLITEAAERSGTLHTANFATIQGKAVYAVPGNITSPMSSGTNILIKQGRATLTTDPTDILAALGMATNKKKQKPTSQNPNEQIILDLIYSGTAEGAELLAKSNLDIQLFTQTLTMLEITGDIKSLGNNKWALA